MSGKSILDTNQSFLTYEQFERDFTRNLKYNKTFSAHMLDLMRDEFAYEYIENNQTYRKVKITNKVIFERVMRLSTNIYDHIHAQKGENNYIPSMQTLMTLCVVYALDMTMVVTLMDSLGLRFKHTDKLHQAYCFLIVNCRGKSLDYCNDVLRELKVEKKYYIGQRALRTRKKQKEEMTK